MGTCAAEEIPVSWRNEPSSHESESSMEGGSETHEYLGGDLDHYGSYPSTLGQVTRSMRGQNDLIRYLEATAKAHEDEDEDEWIDMSERGSDQCVSGGRSAVYGSHGTRDDSVYVNLLQNPEGYTGYRGPSAQRVWMAIQEENCFSPQMMEAKGGEEDQCLEKRAFHRLMSGLQV